MVIRFLTLSFLLIAHTCCLAGDEIVLHGKTTYLKITGRMMDIYEDKEADKSFKQISRPASSYLFHNNAFEEPLFYNTSAVYWLRFRLSSEDSTHHLYRWMLELEDLNFSEVTFYQTKDGVHYSVAKSGLDLPFFERSVKHKNNLFLLDLPEGTSHYVYLQFKVSRPVKGSFALWGYGNMLTFSNTQYFLLALFYGIALAMMLYNLFLFLTIRDGAYIYYVGYILSMVLYTLSLDGLGFQYVWPSYPFINDHVQHISIFSLLIFALLYSRSFLKPVFRASTLDRVFISVIVFRAAIFIAGLTAFPGLLNIPFFDILAMLFIYGVGIYALFRGYTPARFFILAFTMLFIGFAVTSLASIGVLKGMDYLQYALNVGVTCEMILLSFSLADRIKLLLEDRSKAREQVINQLQEKEQLKDRLNRMLEDKVLERTKELEDKNKQLDSLIYKSSHDLKGPLKSIIGLTTVGKMDVKDPAAREYFDHILLSTKRLDRVLADLLDITKVNENKLKHERVDFAHIIKEILLSFENIEGFKDMKIDVRIQQEKDFYGDEKMLYSVFQNMIENAFKYRDQRKTPSTLDVSVVSDKQKTKMEFRDNGLGIDSELKDKVFDMFFKANEQSLGTGLGLYLVKLSVQKMGGHVYLHTTKGEGSLFTIVF
jgi:signal transduction histidine kinase